MCEERNDKNKGSFVISLFWGLLAISISIYFFKWVLNDIFYYIVIIADFKGIEWLASVLNVICYIFTTIVFLIIFKNILNYGLKISNLYGNQFGHWVEELKEKNRHLSTIKKIKHSYPPEEAEKKLNELYEAYSEDNYSKIKLIEIEVAIKNTEIKTSILWSIIPALLVLIVLLVISDDLSSLDRFDQIFIAIFIASSIIITIAFIIDYLDGAKRKKLSLKAKDPNKQKSEEEKQ
ncbi:MAG: hypothetical protein J6U56_02550 [Spirochaetia bacterium]|nr:hypothetical protein [Spirochaetia bacterium]